MILLFCEYMQDFSKDCVLEKNLVSQLKHML